MNKKRTNRREELWRLKEKGGCNKHGSRGQEMLVGKQVARGKSTPATRKQFVQCGGKRYQTCNRVTTGASLPRGGKGTASVMWEVAKSRTTYTEYFGRLLWDARGQGGGSGKNTRARYNTSYHQQYKGDVQINRFDGQKFWQDGEHWGKAYAK